MKLKNFDFTQKVYLHPEHVIKLKNNQRPFPMTIEVDLTNHCNHKCSFVMADPFVINPQSNPFSLVNDNIW